jgi:hypothetical protein
MAMGDAQTVTGAKTFNTGTLKVQSTAAGFLMNSTAGVVSYGNGAAEFPTAIDAAKIADGSVSNTEFQYLNGVSTAIQTQINNGGVAANQAEQEAGTEAGKWVAPATQQFHPCAAKGWVKFAGADAAIAASYNVSGVVKDGTGEYTVSWATDFSSENYVVMVNIVNAAGSRPLGHLLSQAAGSCVVRTITASATNSDWDAVMVVAFGDQ